MRPKDNDWTADYVAWMRGPIWGRPDSGMPGPPSLPERYHQINWGLKGLDALNAPAAKKRRFLFSRKTKDRFYASPSTNARISQTASSSTQNPSGQ